MSQKPPPLQDNSSSSNDPENQRGNSDQMASEDNSVLPGTDEDEASRSINPLAGDDTLQLPAVDNTNSSAANNADNASADDQGIAAQALSDAELASHVVPGLNPENTVVNLFNYSTNQFRNSGWKPELNGSDTLGATGDALPKVNYETWLNDPKSINYGHLLTFGDGMRHLGYWNQGIVAAYGTIAYNRPGMQNIVAPTLSGGYPSINNPDPDSEAAIGPNGELLGGYNFNPPLYSTKAIKTNTDEMVYANAGPLFTNTIATSAKNEQFNPVLAWNIDPVVQAQAIAVAAGSSVDFSKFPSTDSKALALTKKDIEGTDKFGINWNGYELSPEVLSLQYLFDPGVTNAGKESYKNVTGLFQVDDEGYYYYNMRENFAEYVNDPDERNGLESSGRFVLYDAPAGIRTDGDSIGNFLPFNKANEVFKLGTDGKLENNLNTNNTDSTKPFADHHLGMTVETEFRQPVDGFVAEKPMTFEFIGDDDLWVFIDDVLVLDLGGIHSELYGTIDFSTGDVNLGTAFNSNGNIYNESGKYITEPKIATNIKEMFTRAGKADEHQWNGNTFASSTSHTLKMFYLERGNYDSSLSVRFNLQPALFQQLKKVDQNGEPLAGAEFDLYEVKTPANVTLENADKVTLSQVTPESDPVSHVKTDSQGMAQFTDPSSKNKDAKADPFNFADRYTPAEGDNPPQGLFYILRETKAPAGYKKLPTDLLLRFDPNTTTLIVNNRYESGSYASFNSFVSGITGSTYYGQIADDGGYVDSLEPQIGAAAKVSKDSQQYGLVVAVPLLEKTNKTRTAHWLPLYGDNLSGFSTVPYPDDINLNDLPEYRLAIRELTLKAALMQAAEYANGEGEPWHLSWDPNYDGLKAVLENLPGRVGRYRNVNPQGDMLMFYAIIEPDALANVLGKTLSEIKAMSSSQRYEALGKLAAEKLAAGRRGEAELDALVDAIGVGSTTSLPGPNNRGYSPLDVREFIRNFRSVLYVPNERRSLRVIKVDQNGQRVNGVSFGLYNSEEAAKAGGEQGRVASGVTASVQGQDGMLIFEPLSEQSKNTAGYAHTEWINADPSDPEAARTTYYLKELAAPAGFTLNDTIVPVKVGVYSIYADAGTANDGITVMAGVGKLNQSMIKYASDGDVNITLRDITTFAQSQPSGEFTMTGWTDEALAATGQNKVLRSMNLHYGINQVIDYGLSDADGGQVYQPFFVTDTGFIRTRVQQNLHEHDDPNDPFYSNAAADDLGDTDITGLFSLINTVVVSDYDKNAPEAGELAIRKTVEAAEGVKATGDDYTRLFHFKVELFGADGSELPGSFNFYGTERAGSVKSGDVLPLHHDEEVVIQGIPAGATYKVTETDGNKDGFTASPALALSDRVKFDTVHHANFLNTKTGQEQGGYNGPGGGDDGKGDEGENPNNNGTNPNKPLKDSLGQLPATGDSPLLLIVAGLALAALLVAVISRRQGAKERKLVHRRH